MTHHLSEYMSACQKDMVIALFQKFQFIEVNTIGIDARRVEFTLSFAHHTEKYNFIWNDKEQIPGPVTCFISQGCVLASGDTASECVDKFIKNLVAQLTSDYAADLRVADSSHWESYLL